MKYYYKKVRDKATKTLADIALDKFVKSDYLRDTTTILPLTLLTTVTRSVFNFLITSRLKTDIYLFDFFLSLCITVFFSFYSPFLYNILNIILEKEVKDFSANFIESIWKDGFQYIQFWKVRIGSAIGIFLIFLLFFVEINSRMIQESIVHLLISSGIVDYLNNLNHLKIEDSKKKEDKEKERTSPLSIKVMIPQKEMKEILLTSSNSYTNLLSVDVKEWNVNGNVKDNVKLRNSKGNVKNDRKGKQEENYMFIPDYLTLDNGEIYQSKS